MGAPDKAPNPKKANLQKVRAITGRKRETIDETLPALLTAKQVFSSGSTS
jgi:hypothetical protein